MGLLYQVKSPLKNHEVVQKTEAPTQQKPKTPSKPQPSHGGFVLNTKVQNLSQCWQSSSTSWTCLTYFQPTEVLAARFSNLAESHPVLGQLRQMGESVADAIQASASLMQPVVSGVLKEKSPVWQILGVDSIYERPACREPKTECESVETFLMWNIF